MNRKLSQHMSLLGLCAMMFYGAMLACGQLSLDVLPQFAVSAFIFLASGNLIRRTAKARDDEEEDERPEAVDKTAKQEKEEPDWQFMANWLNWSMVVVVIGIMAAWVMTPAGVTFIDVFHQTTANESYNLLPIP
ncbi:MAG: hypothetical protein C0616_03905 [Desulfuromonas sp.]|nr:MAG: hypothetical protein C0616_03905 [Desulfuromonas sp.]